MPFPTTSLSKPPQHQTNGVDYFDTLATEKQVKMIKNRAIVAGLCPEWESWAMCFKPVAHLSKREAKTLLDYLREGAQF